MGVWTSGTCLNPLPTQPKKLVAREMDLAPFGLDQLGSFEELDECHSSYETADVGPEGDTATLRTQGPST